MPRILAAIALGWLLGIAGAHALFLRWWTLVPWGLGGIVLGYWTKRRETAISGALYGFILVFVFLIGGYTGDIPLRNRLPFFALLGLFGGVCGLILTLVGSFVKTRSTGRAAVSGTPSRH